MRDRRLTGSVDSATLIVVSCPRPEGVQHRSRRSPFVSCILGHDFSHAQRVLPHLMTGDVVAVDHRGRTQAVSSRLPVLQNKRLWRKEENPKISLRGEWSVVEFTSVTLLFCRELQRCQRFISFPSACVSEGVTTECHVSSPAMLQSSHTPPSPRLCLNTDKSAPDYQILIV